MSERIIVVPGWAVNVKDSVKDSAVDGVEFQRCPQEADH